MCVSGGLTVLLGRCVLFAFKVFPWKFRCTAHDVSLKVWNNLLLRSTGTAFLGQISLNKFAAHSQMSNLRILWHRLYRCTKDKRSWMRNKFSEAFHAVWMRDAMSEVDRFGIMLWPEHAQMYNFHKTKSTAVQLCGSDEKNYGERRRQKLRRGVFFSGTEKKGKAGTNNYVESLRGLDIGLLLEILPLRIVLWTQHTMTSSKPLSDFCDLSRQLKSDRRWRCSDRKDLWSLEGTMQVVLSHLAFLSLLQWSPALNVSTTKDVLWTQTLCFTPTPALWTFHMCAHTELAEILNNIRDTVAENKLPLKSRITLYSVKFFKLLLITSQNTPKINKSYCNQNQNKVSVGLKNQPHRMRLFLFKLTQILLCIGLFHTLATKQVSRFLQFFPVK